MLSFRHACFWPLFASSCTIVIVLPYFSLITTHFNIAQNFSYVWSLTSCSDGEEAFVPRAKHVPRLLLPNVVTRCRNCSVFGRHKMCTRAICFRAWRNSLRLLWSCMWLVKYWSHVTFWSDYNSPQLYIFLVSGIAFFHEKDSLTILCFRGSERAIFSLSSSLLKSAVCCRFQTCQHPNVWRQISIHVKKTKLRDMIIYSRERR